MAAACKIVSGKEKTNWERVHHCVSQSESQRHRMKSSRGGSHANRRTHLCAHHRLRNAATGATRRSYLLKGSFTGFKKEKKKKKSF